MADSFTGANTAVPTTNYGQPKNTWHTNHDNAINSLAKSSGQKTKPTASSGSTQKPTSQKNPGLINQISEAIDG